MANSEFTCDRYSISTYTNIFIYRRRRHGLYYQSLRCFTHGAYWSELWYLIHWRNCACWCKATAFVTEVISKFTRDVIVLLEPDHCGIRVHGSRLSVGNVLLLKKRADKRIPYVAGQGSVPVSLFSVPLARLQKPSNFQVYATAVTSVPIKMLHQSFDLRCEHRRQS